MRKINHILPVAALLLTFIYSGCVVEVIPCFNKDKDEIEPGETVNFTNCSFRASTYQWDFGDGTYSTDREPSHTYNVPGFYTISMIARNKSGNKEAEIGDVITVGYPMIDDLQVIGIPATDANGDPWDAGDNPDVQLFLREGSGPGATWDVTTPENTDLANPVPFTWNWLTQEVAFTDAIWYYELRENDPGTYQVISSGTFNPIGDAVNKIIEINDGGTGLRFNYEISY